MRGWMIGVCAVLTAGAARAEEGSVPYAKVGAWEIEAETARNLCKMVRLYGSSADKHIEGLFVRYDAGKDAVSLTWTTDAMTDLPAEGDVDLRLSFVKGKSLDESWGSRTFHYRKPADTHYFSQTFEGSRDSRRILRDLAGNALFGLERGPTLLTALSLDASEATDKLRECSLKLAGRA